MWVYFSLGLLVLLSSFWISDLIDLLVVPAPPLKAFYEFGGHGPENHPHIETVSIVKEDTLFILQAEVDRPLNLSRIRLYEQDLESVLENKDSNWKHLWSLELAGVMYMGTTGYNSTNFACAFMTSEGFTELLYWPHMRSEKHVEILLVPKLTSLSLYNNLIILSYLNYPALFYFYTYSVEYGLEFQSATPKTGDFVLQEAVGSMITHSHDITWATIVTYGKSEAPHRQLEFYSLNQTAWKLYGTYTISSDLLYLFFNNDKLMTAPRFAVRQEGTELLIGHFGFLISVIKWSPDNVELFFLDTYSTTDFRYVSCTDDLVLLANHNSMSLLVSYEEAGNVYDPSFPLSIKSVEAVINQPSIIHARLAKRGENTYAILVFQEGLAVLDLTGHYSQPSFWTEDFVLSLFASCIVIILLVRRLPYMRNGHHRPLLN
mmetsp:Transcript_19553/g.35818  ORF Transcript_19553/g.35818 Transcript_19553/m.35818 type:complete len:432 (+) Transcript_19553:1867-3162(+)